MKRHIIILSITFVAFIIVWANHKSERTCVRTMIYYGHISDEYLDAPDDLASKMKVIQKLVDRCSMIGYKKPLMMYYETRDIIRKKFGLPIKTVKIFDDSD